MASKVPAHEFSRISAPRYLEATYYAHVYDGLARGRDGVSPEALQSDIQDLARRMSDRLRSGNYRFTRYRELLQSKGANRAPRIISVPTARDRITLRALAELLSVIYPQSRGPMPQQRVAEVKEALTHARYDGFIKLDIQNFFPSIEHGLIESALRRRIRKQEIIDAIMGAVSTATVADRGKSAAINTIGIPQGLSISNALAELVVHPIDEVFRNDTRCKYLRFVDDVLILCDSSDADDIYEQAEFEFRNRGLTVHPLGDPASKSQKGRTAMGFDYLGYRFDSTQISVRDSSVRNLESSMARIFTRFHKTNDEERPAAIRLCRRRINLLVTGCIYEDNPYGWLNYYRQLDDRKLLKRLDATVARFLRRFDMPSNFEVKSFLRAHWAILHPHGRDRRYIPNFDGLDADGMRELISDFIGEDAALRLPDRAVSRVFKRVMKQVTSELERDARPIS